MLTSALEKQTNAKTRNKIDETVEERKSKQIRKYKNMGMVFLL